MLLKDGRKDGRPVLGAPRLGHVAVWWMRWDWAGYSLQGHVKRGGAEICHRLTVPAGGEIRQN